MFFGREPRMVTPDEALPGRDEPMPVVDPHHANGTRITPPWPSGARTLVVGMGCFWGAERVFWQTPGVITTAVGYAGGYTPNPTYREVCTGRTGHTEVVLVAFDTARCSDADLLRVFWEHHDPTQGMRQGNDVGTQYRSAVFACDDAQLTAAIESADAYESALAGAGLGPITTEITGPQAFYYAEPEHQQYLSKHVDGYCGLGGTGVACPTGFNVTEG
jgi:peptide-methionine (S)-S-oxide reductase